MRFAGRPRRGHPNATLLRCDVRHSPRNPESPPVHRAQVPDGGVVAAPRRRADLIEKKNARRNRGHAERFRGQGTCHHFTLTWRCAKEKNGPPLGRMATDELKRLNGLEQHNDRPQRLHN